jgi:hypothetical protein
MTLPDHAPGVGSGNFRAEAEIHIAAPQQNVKDRRANPPANRPGRPRPRTKGGKDVLGAAGFRLNRDCTVLHIFSIISSMRHTLDLKQDMLPGVPIKTALWHLQRTCVAACSARSKRCTISWKTIISRGSARTRFGGTKAGGQRFAW